MWSELFIAIVLLSFTKLSYGAPTFASELVPYIDTNDFELKPLDNGYFLSVRNPDGTLREETVREIAPGQLEVKGTLDQYFDDRGKQLKVSYEAGANGYVAKFSYGNPKPTQFTTASPSVLPTPPPPPPTYVPVPLNGCTLKTCTG